MKKTLHVLSIDFDFFQNVDEQTIFNHYPDGIDNVTTIANIIWASHYANPYDRKHILSVTPKLQELQQLTQLIKTSSTKLPPESLIVNSHMYAYNMIMDYMHYHPEYNKLNLINIDMHHDLINDNPNLDCGNWISCVINQLRKDNIKTKVTWICNPLSLDIYNLKKGEFKEHVMEKYGIEIHTNLSPLKDIAWNLIFLCRSDIWLPPHLDEPFQQLANFIIDHSISADMEEGILDSRYTKEFVKTYQKIELSYRKEASKHAD